MLEEKQSKRLFPKYSDKIVVINHSFNEEKTLEPGLRSSLKMTDKKNILVGIDTKTTDRTKELCLDYGVNIIDLTWIWNFAYAKNTLLKEAMRLGILNFGDVVQTLGGHFQFMDDYIKDLQLHASNPLECLWQTWVVEKAPAGEKQVADLGRWAFRHHPLFYFEGIVHEAIQYAVYRVTGKGDQVNQIYQKEAPIIGCAKSKIGILHTGREAKGGEHGEKYQRDKMLYKILDEIKRNSEMWCIPLDEPSRSRWWLDGGWLTYENKMPENMRYIMEQMSGEKVIDIGQTINRWVDNLMQGKVVAGISPFTEARPNLGITGHV